MFEPTGSGTADAPLTLREWVMVIFLLVVFVVYGFGRQSIGPTPFVDKYTPPIELPDGEWNELVLTPPSDGLGEVAGSYTLSKIPDLVPHSSEAFSDPAPSTIRIDRESLESVCAEAQAIAEYFEEYGNPIAAYFPRNRSRTRQRELEVKDARDQLIYLSTIIDNLPDQNVSYE